MNGFRNGNIISLSLSNFQIFKEQTFHFQPALNLIAAPNGSGKSSIANALAFVLSGAAKTIGKSKEMSEFIKFGEENASITAVIFVEGKMVEMRRTISKGTRTSRYVDMQAAVSQFFINGSIVSPTEYSAYISSIGIDVNNLCTFLPQERVAEFCTMDPPALLIEALKGTDITLDRFNELKAELEGIEAVIAAKSKTKQLVENTISGMETGVKKFKEKEELEKLSVKMAYKMLRLRHDQAVAEYKASKKMVAAGEANLALLQKEVEGCEEVVASIEADEVFKEYKQSIDRYAMQNSEINEIVSQMKKYSTELELKKIDGASHIRGRDQKTMKIMGIEKKCGEAENELAAKRKEWGEMVESFKESLKAYFKENKEEGNMDLLNKAQGVSDLMKMLPSFEQIEKSIVEVVDRIRQVQFFSGQTQKEIDELEEQKVNYLEQKGQRMELLKKYHMDTYKAVCWLRNNLNSCAFEHPVLEPAFLHVNIHKEYSQEVESLLSFQCLSSFLVRNQHDFVALSRMLKDEQKLSVNIAEVVSETVKMNELDRDALKKYGIDGVASDFIEADEEYLSMFCVYSLLSSVPVSKGSVNDSELFNSNPKIKRIVADGQFIEIKRSRYSSEWIVSSNKITTRGIFNFPKIDLEETERRLCSLAEKREENKNEMAVLLARREELKAKRESIRKKFDLSHIQKSEYAQDNILSRLDSNKKNICALKEEIECYNIKILKGGEEEKVEVEKLKELAKELEKILDVLGVPKFDLEKIKDRNLDLENSRKKYLMIKAQLEHDTRGVSDAKGKLMKYKGEVNETKCRIKEDFKTVSFSAEELKEVPDVIEEIEHEMNGVNARIHVLEGQTGVMKMYEDKDRERRKLGDAIGDLKEHQTEQARMLGAEKIRLINAICEYLKPMKSHFSAMFAKLGFIGDLRLSSDDNWGLHIMVRFREGEELQQLSSYRQSGGEKSLSTVLFLLALQQTNPAPFRLVDEINQGMDAVNERAVFNIIREMSIESQFFIITPKLVKGLEFSETANSIILYGGPGITSDLENYACSLLH